VPATFGVLSGGDNPLDDARIMRALDLVISVDTMTAHLAGALGQQTWTLLPFNADWRWMKDRNDSPWYPTMRLFRQKREDDWNKVIDDVARELQQQSR
jgi:ADP-heptose:LPS heptosyltransferase